MVDDRSTGDPAHGAGVADLPDSFARKLDRLFRTFRCPEKGTEFSYDYVAESIATAGGPTISANYVYMLRRGIRDNPTKKHLEALAGFFGVPIGYFFDNPHQPERDDLELTAALRSPGVRRIAAAAATLPAPALDAVHQLIEATQHLDPGRPIGRAHPTDPPDQEHWADQARRGPESLPLDPHTSGSTGAAVSEALRRTTVDGPLATPADGLTLREPGTAEPSRVSRAELELAYARLALRNGEAAAARDRLLALTAVPGHDRAGRDELDLLLAQAHEKLGDLPAAAGVLLPLHRRCLHGTSRLPANDVSMALCRVYLLAGDLDAAVRVAEEGLRACERDALVGTDGHLRLAATLMAAHLELGNLVHCSALAQELLQLAQASGSAMGLAAVYWNSSLAAEARGDVVEALRLSHRSLAIMSERETVRDLPRLRTDVARIILRCDPGRAAEASALLDQTLPVLQDLGGENDLGEWHLARGHAHLLLGEPELAEISMRTALRMLGSSTRSESARGLVFLGDAVATQDRHEEALEHYQAAMTVLEDCPRSRAVAAIWRDLAERLATRGDPATQEAYRRALDACGVRAVPLAESPLSPALTPIEGRTLIPSPQSVEAAQRDLDQAAGLLRRGRTESAHELVAAVLASAGLPLPVRDQALLLLAQVQEATGDLPAAVATLTQVVDRCLREDPRAVLAPAAAHLCGLHQTVGDLDAAVHTAEDALAGLLARGTREDDDGVLRLRCVLLICAHLSGSLREAGSAAELVHHALKRRVGLPEGTADACLAPGDEGPEAAAERGTELGPHVLAVVLDHDLLAGLPPLQIELAALVARTDRTRAVAAGRLLDTLPDGAPGPMSPPTRAAWACARSLVHRLCGEPAAAEVQARAALDLLDGHPGPLAARAHLELAAGLACRPDPSRAAEQYRAAVRDLDGVPLSRAHAAILREAADGLVAVGRPDADLYRRALDLAGVAAGQAQQLPLDPVRPAGRTSATSSPSATGSVSPKGSSSHSGSISLDDPSSPGEDLRARGRGTRPRRTTAPAGGPPRR